MKVIVHDSLDEKIVFLYNDILNKAKKSANDEFYTPYDSIEKEVPLYSKFLKDKIIYCNCDDILKSEFIYYFILNFNRFNLKKFIATGLSGYKLEVSSVSPDITKSQISSILKSKKSTNSFSISKLSKDDDKPIGDYSSTECLELLKECDIIITNPPFSLFRDYINTLFKFKKKFLIVGSNMAGTYLNVIPHIMDSSLRVGYNHMRYFVDKSSNSKKEVRCWWYTNLNKPYPNPILLSHSYNKKDYPKYENYNAINVNSYTQIPKDYYGVMGVPVSFIEYFNPKQFKILGIAGRGVGSNYATKFFKSNPSLNSSAVIKKGNKFILKFCRILIQQV